MLREDGAAVDALARSVGGFAPLLREDGAAVDALARSVGGFTPLLRGRADRRMNRFMRGEAVARVAREERSEQSGRRLLSTRSALTYPRGFPRPSG